MFPLTDLHSEVPTHIASGSSPIIAMINFFRHLSCKLLIDQIPFLLTFIVVVGAALGAIGGERVYRQLSRATLRRIYATLVTTIALRVWLTLLA
jgi:uncharacterized membrane protein YfcA